MAASLKQLRRSCAKMQGITIARLIKGLLQLPLAGNGRRVHPRSFQCLCVCVICLLFETNLTSPHDPIAGRHMMPRPNKSAVNLFNNRKKTTGRVSRLSL